MNNLQIFNNPEFGEIRTIQKDGEPWFVGKDVASALGYKDTVSALKSKVDTEDKAGWQITTQFGTKETTIINESGLYCLIFSSKLEKAKRFKSWVTHEVLPSIRKTGGYIPEFQPAPPPGRISQRRGPAYQGAAGHHEGQRAAAGSDFTDGIDAVLAVWHPSAGQLCEGVPL